MKVPSNFQRFDEPVTVVFQRNASVVFYLFNCTYLYVFITIIWGYHLYIIYNAAIEKLATILIYTVAAGNWKKSR